MKRFLTTSVVMLELLIVAAGAAPAAHAQVEFDTPQINAQAAAIDSAATGKSAATVGAAVSAAAAKIDPADASKPIDFAGSKDLKPDNMVGQVMNLFMSIFAWLLGVAMITLNYAVYYTVVIMGTYVHKLAAVGIAWRVLRDVGNIMLIFGFLSVGITTILGVDWYGIRKMLPMLLVAAVFLNFSLFISEAVIDTGNLFATQFYTQINGGTFNADTVANTTISNEGISNKIMAQLGLAQIYAAARSNKDVLLPGTSVFIAFMSVILFIVASFVMFSLAFILIARFVALIFLIILAPIGFAGLAVPQLKARADQWWGELFKQTVTAPILLLMLYIALLIITDANFLGFGPAGKWTGFIASETGVAQNYASFASVLLSFLVAMGLLLAVTLRAKSLAAFGAGWATKAAGALTFGAVAYGASAATGVTAFGARRGLQRYAPNNRFTRGLSRGLRSAEGLNMDIRSIPAVAGGLGAMGAEGAAKPIGKSAAGRVRQGVEFMKKGGEEANREFDKETRMPRLTRAIATNDSATVSQILGNMSDKELEEASMQRFLANPDNTMALASLPHNRFDKLMTSDALNDAQKSNLRTRRGAGLTTRYTDTAEHRNPANHPTAPNAAVPSVWHPGTNASRGEVAMRALSNDDASHLPDSVIANPNVYHNLSLRQLNSIQSAGRIQDSTATTVGAYLITDPAFVAYYATRNPQQQADLDAFWHI